MSDITVAKRTLGINFKEDGKATIKVWAPYAQSASLNLIAKDKKLPLEKDDFGYYRGETDELKAGDRYNFVLDKKQILPDPASLAQPEGVHGASEAFGLSNFEWKDQKWKNLPLQEYIIYELHTGTFTQQGGFEGISDKLDYLKDLGINAIEIMPVSQFPGDRNWGYDGVFPFAVQKSYGGAEGLRKLVDACHEKGLAVVLDVVYNHLGPEGNYLGGFGPYFTDKYHTPWGKALNFDDAWCDAVREYFIENVLMWFRDFHIDALRLDAVHAIKDFSPTHILKEIKQEVNKLMKENGRFHYLIVELDLNDVRYINPLAQQGYGMDAQWIDEFHHALRVTAGGDKSGYYADFNGIKHLAKAYKDAYVYNGIYSPNRFKTFGTEASNNPGSQFIVFSQNHDQVGNRMLGERTSELVSFEMQKLLAGAVIVAPYLPMLFMGEEYSEKNPFQYFVSHTDPDLVEAVRKGRKAEFADFHALGEAPDPQAEATFQNSKLNWNLLDQMPHKTMHAYYKSLIAIRKKYPALHQLDRQQLEVEANEAQNTLMLHRWSNENHIICLMNFSTQQQEVKVPNFQKSWKKVLSSADTQWDGLTNTPEKINKDALLSLAPASILIYTSYA